MYLVFFPVISYPVLSHTAFLLLFLFSKMRSEVFSLLCGIILTTVEPGHPPVQEGCGEDPGEGCQDGQWSVVHGLQEVVEGAGLVQSGKEKSESNLIADYTYLKIVTRIRATQQVQTIQGTTGSSCTLEGSYQEIPGEGWCSPEKGHQGGGGISILEAFQDSGRQSHSQHHLVLATVPSQTEWD